jgi:hypothetical protein
LGATARACSAISAKKRFLLGGRHLADRFEQPARIEPVDNTSVASSTASADGRGGVDGI